MMKTSTWSCGSSPRVLTDSLRCALNLPAQISPVSDQHICIIITAKDVTNVNELMPSSVLLLFSWERKNEQLVFHMEICVQKSWVLPSCSLYPYSIKRRFRLCIYFPLANQICFFFFLFLVMWNTVHNTVTQAGSHCCAALQYAPLSHQNKALQRLKKQQGISEEVSSYTEPFPQLHLNSMLLRRDEVCINTDSTLFLVLYIY